MKTPNTDAVANRAFLDPATDDYAGCVTMLDHARRLEQDREIFRQSLIKIYTSPPDKAGEAILQAFRDASVFPGEVHEP